jgi:hypothetical protein
MPLPPASKRQHIHTRTISYHGYERDDGLFEIEAHMTDTKSYEFSNDWRGKIKVGEALHEMLLRVTLDDRFEIKDIEAATDNSPFAMCPDIAPNYKALIGITMGAGWRKAIRQKVGGKAGCTHLTELLFPMATVAFQTISPLKWKRRKESGAAVTDSPRRPQVLDTCHAWASDSPVVKKNAPKFYTGK